MKLSTLLLACFLAGADASEPVDRAAIGELINAFNHPTERAALLTAGAEIPDLTVGGGIDYSDLYFTAGGIRFLASDLALVSASGKRYNSMMIPSGVSATFLVKKEGERWSVAMLMLGPRCRPL